jgi:GDP-D-glucose phosphorylase
MDSTVFIDIPQIDLMMMHSLHRSSSVAADNADCEATDNKSAFDLSLCRAWDRAMAAGTFRYDLSQLKTKVVILENNDNAAEVASSASSSPRIWNFVAQLNILRGTSRRAPQTIDAVNQAFNPNAFHFMKVHRNECLFWISSGEWTSLSSEIKEGENMGHPLDNSVDRSNKCGIKHTIPTTLQHLVIINVSPLEYGNVLIVPSIRSQLPQILTRDAIALAVDITYASTKPHFVVGFNSLCAFASVNHLHLHAVYLPTVVPVTRASIKPIVIADDDMVQLYELLDWPVPGFVFVFPQLQSSSDSNCRRAIKDVIIDSIHVITSYFIANNIPHNMLVSKVNNTVHVWLWPRQHSKVSPSSSSPSSTSTTHCGGDGGGVDGFNVAFCELAGHIPVFDSELFWTITESVIIKALSSAALPTEQFILIRDTLVALLSAVV